MRPTAFSEPTKPYMVFGGDVLYNRVQLNMVNPNIMETNMVQVSVKQPDMGLVSSSTLEKELLILVPRVPNQFIMQDERIVQLFKEKVEAEAKVLMLKLSQGEPSTYFKITK